MPNKIVKSVLLVSISTMILTACGNVSANRILNETKVVSTNVKEESAKEDSKFNISNVEEVTMTQKIERDDIVGFYNNDIIYSKELKKKDTVISKLYRVNLTEQKEKQITENNTLTESLYGDNVVYQDNKNVFIYDLSTEKTKIIIKKGNDMNYSLGGENNQYLYYDNDEKIIIYDYINENEYIRKIPAPYYGTMNITICNDYLYFTPNKFFKKEDIKNYIQKRGIPIWNDDDKILLGGSFCRMDFKKDNKIEEIIAIDTEKLNDEVNDEVNNYYIYNEGKTIVIRGRIDGETGLFFYDINSNKTIKFITTEENSPAEYCLSQDGSKIVYLTWEEEEQGGKMNAQVASIDGYKLCNNTTIMNSIWNESQETFTTEILDKKEKEYNNLLLQILDGKSYWNENSNTLMLPMFEHKIIDIGEGQKDNEPLLSKVLIYKFQ